MRNSGFLWIIIGIMVVLDVYVFQAIKVVAPASPKLRIGMFICYWILMASTVSLSVISPSPFSNLSTEDIGNLFG